MSLEELKARFAGKRVKYVGMRGTTDGPIAKVWRVTNSGVWVTMPDGSRQQWHPDDLAIVEHGSTSVTPTKHG